VYPPQGARWHVPQQRCRWPHCAAWKSSSHGRWFALPPEIMDKARLAAAAAGGSVTENLRRAAALGGASVLYAKEWGTTAYYGDVEADLPPAGRPPTCASESDGSHGAARAKLMHACRCPAMWPSPMKYSMDPAPSSSARPSIVCGADGRSVHRHVVLTALDWENFDDESTRPFG